MLKCMDEMKSAHLRNLPKSGRTTCGFENCVTLTEKSKQRRLSLRYSVLVRYGTVRVLYNGTTVLGLSTPYSVRRTRTRTSTSTVSIVIIIIIHII